MFDPHTWHWPQWVEAGLIFTYLACVAGLHGRPKDGSWSFPVALVSASITVFLLTMGGFFGARF